jgi:hypothetical protein
MKRLGRRGQSAAVPNPICAHSSGSGTATHPVCALVSAPWIPRSGAVSGGGLGPARGLLPIPQPHWQHLRTTNPVESPFAAARLRTDAAKRFRVVKNTTAVIWPARSVQGRTGD